MPLHLSSFGLPHYFPSSMDFVHVGGPSELSLGTWESSQCPGRKEMAYSKGFNIRILTKMWAVSQHGIMKLLWV